MYNVRIRPFYIKGQTYRLSEPQELKAIEEITDILRKHHKTKAIIEPIQIIEKNDFRPESVSLISNSAYQNTVFMQ